MRPIAQFLVFSWLCMTGSVAVAATAAENLQRLLTNIHAFSADFEQLILDNSGTRLQSTTGHVDLERPGHFRWKSEEPFPQLLVSNGETLWVYDEDLEQVTQQKVDQRISQTPALLLSGDLSKLPERFSISGPSSGDEGVYKLVPKDPDAMFVVLRILFVKGAPAEMQLEDNLGQQTSLQFHGLDVNPKLDSSLFEFDVPPGVDLIAE